MKTICLQLAIIIFAIFGCNDSSLIIEPDLTTPFSKGIATETTPPDSADQIPNLDKLSDDNQINDGKDFLLKRSSNRTSTIKTSMSKNFTVSGNIGGTLLVKHRWKAKGKRVNLIAKLKIPEGAFKGNLTFDMIFDLENYALQLYPSPIKFDMPLLLNLVFRNVDFTTIDVQNPDFIYLDGDEEMKYEKITFDSANGVIEVKGAQLDHFSRYGWSRKK